MRIDLPSCSLKSCRYCNDGNCTDAKDYKDCILRDMIQIPQNATNCQTFISVFGIDAWKQMIEFSNLNEQFKEFWEAPYNWEAPYKAESEDKE